jgi:alpha-soluble NSF attachment protein
MSQEAEANALMLQAAGTLTSFFSWWRPSNSTYEAASEKYVKAANLYKVAKKWGEAGKAFLKSADCQIKAQNKHEAASNYVDASNCFKKVDTPEAINCLKLSIDIFLDMGRFSVAAKHHKEIAELYENEANLDESIKHYTTAAEYFASEEATSSVNQCFLKVAQFGAQLERYDLAIEKFEQVAQASIENTLLKYSVKEYLLKSGLCHLATTDVIGARRALEKYQEMDVTFSSTRECKFLKDITDAYENSEVEAFTNAVVEFDRLSPLDNWKTSILLRIKNALNGESSLT